LGHLFEKEKRIARVELDGMQIHLPPRGDRPELGAGSEGPPPTVLFEDIIIRNSQLVILPKRRDRVPLAFDLHQVRVLSAGIGRAMQYEAELTNPKPPGAIRSKGSFGPWNAAEPDDTPLAGEYVFENADLGVFKAIAGRLRPTGSFKGSLSSIDARGTATAPDFRLKRSGNRVPLRTEFQVLMDGTNGDTTLRPVRAMLGSTRITTSGAIIKHDGERRTISLNVNMPAGRSVRSTAPGAEGRSFDARDHRTEDAHRRAATFRKGNREADPRRALRHPRWQVPQVIGPGQDRFAPPPRQGQPRNQAIDEVFSNMSGVFRMEDQAIQFRELTFGVPGADINLAGRYDMDADNLDFRGGLRLKAKVSQTQSGWKRWALKPADPEFGREKK
jgi:hypothetical protein